MPGISRMFTLYIFIGLSLISPLFICSQAWEFEEEDGGIKIYLRDEPGSSLKAYKGVVVLNAEMDYLYRLIVDFDNYNRWVEDIEGMKTLSFVEDSSYIYYMVFKMPWPYSNRDLVAEAIVTMEPSDRQRIVYSKPIPDHLAEQEDLIRIREFWQRWTITRLDSQRVELILEGFTDPAGPIPAWLYNMLIVNTPRDLLKNIRKEVLQ